MPHISFSELKNWCKCPFYHKLVNLDKLKKFIGNEHTSFGTAMHSSCELLLAGEGNLEELKKNFELAFLSELKQIAQKSDEGFKTKLVQDMRVQGKLLLPFIYPALEDYFGQYEVVSIEEQIYEPIEEYKEEDYSFKGFIDAVVKTPDGKYHIVDWKTCSWGWDNKKKNDKMITYQLTLYKKFFALKHGIELKDIETHFALLKRTAKKNHVELFRVTSGPKKISNALNLLFKSLYNITNRNFIKNKSACRDQYGNWCEFYKTEHCP